MKRKREIDGCPIALLNADRRPADFCFSVSQLDYYEAMMHGETVKKQKMAETNKRTGSAEHGMKLVFVLYFWLCMLP